MTTQTKTQTHTPGPWHAASQLRRTTYEYPAGGRYGETVAVIDGRRYLVDTQYAAVLPLGTHADACSQLITMGGRCDCGLLDGIDVVGLVADARERGKCGTPPQEHAHVPAEPEARMALCPKCGTVCYGDCAS